MNTSNTTQCFVCGDTMEHFLSWKDYWYRTSDKTFEIYKCKKCKLEKVNPTPSVDEQISFYPKDYYSFSLSDNQVWSQKGRLHTSLDRILQHLEDKDFMIEKFITPSEWNKYLDIGCGDGVTLQPAKDKWRQSYGFEFASTVSKKDGIDYGPSIDTINFWVDSFDLIHMRHVFEHLDNPSWYLKWIYNHLDSTWMLMMILPNVDCVSSSILWSFAPDRDIPRHLYNYSLENLKILLDTHGFEIKQYSYLRNYGFALWRNRYTSYTGKYNNKVISIIWRIITWIGDILISYIWKTNQLGLYIKKKNA